MKKIVLTVDEEQLLKLDDKQNLFEYVNNWNKESDLFKNTPAGIGIKIATDGLMLELKKQELKGTEVTEEHKKFVEDYLMHVAFTRVFLLSNIVSNIEVVETED